MRATSKARTAFEESMASAKAAIRARSFDAAWPELERAHVLGQADAWLHLRSHWWMLRCGLAERDLREIIGQLARVAVAAPASWLGRYPLGNTGRARVGMLEPMPIDPRVEALLSARDG